MSVGRKPRKPLPRYSRLVSGKPVKKRNAKRWAQNQARAYAVKNGRADFVKALPCLICGRTPSENAHVTNGGMSRKGDAKLNVPLCGDGLNGHHTEYDGGKRSFVAKYAVQLGGLTMLEHAARVEALWQQHISQGESHAEANRGRDAVTASRRDDEGGLGARGAGRTQGGSGAGPRADLPAAGRGKRGLTPLSAIVPGVYAEIVERAQ